MHSRLSKQDKNTQNKKEMNTSEGNVDKKGSGDVWSDWSRQLWIQRILVSMCGS